MVNGRRSHRTTQPNVLKVNMANEIETSIQTKDGARVGVDQYDESIWLSLQGRRASMHVILNRAEAEQLLVNLKLVLAQEVTA
jgi:hypothetical protein